MCRVVIDLYFHNVGRCFCEFRKTFVFYSYLREVPVEVAKNVSFGRWPEVASFPAALRALFRPLTGSQEKELAASRIIIIIRSQ
jgi:hypothetical protein